MMMMHQRRGLRFSRHPSGSLRLMRVPPGGDSTRVDVEARALMDKMKGLSDQLRSDCGSFNFLGDESACSNSADEIDHFLADRGPRLLALSEGGDDGKHQALVDFCHKMLDFLRTAYDDISAGDTFTDLAGAIVQTAKDDAGKVGKFALPVGGVVAVLGGLYLASRIGK